MNTLYKVLINHTILILCILASFGLIVVLKHVHTLAENQAHAAALQNAKNYTLYMREFRALYTSEVVIKAKNHGIDVSHDYINKEASIPLPATLTILLGKKLSIKEGGVKNRLYSLYPFPWRANTGGLVDQFSQDAWRALTTNKHQPFYRIEAVDGKQQLRYATADLMQDSCLNCHNNHENSPKRDWKSNDVRGVLEVVVPIQSVSILANSIVSSTGLLVVIIIVISLLCIAFVIQWLKKSHNKVVQLNTSLNEEIAQREAAQEELITLSITDPLTGIENRRRFEQEYKVFWLAAIRNQKPIALIMVDIDYFKAYNDNYGHQLGDDTLRIVAKEIREHLSRPTDLVARYGGEEFVILLPDTDLNGAIFICEDLLARIKQKAIPHAFSKVSDIITVSAGIACFVPNQSMSQSHLIKEADDAMYLAKKSGRNCYKVSGT